MTHDEAVRQLENWLLIPVNLEEVLPALVRLKSSEDFEPYVKHVADAEFQSPESIRAEVDRYERDHEGRDDDALSPELAAKLEALAGKPVKLASTSADAGDDILSTIEKNRRELTEEEKKEALRDMRFEAFTQKYVAKNDRSHEATSEDTLPARTCPQCGTALQVRVVEERSIACILLIIVLAIVCLPLILIPIFLCDKQKKTSYTCPKCHHNHVEMS